MLLGHVVGELWATRLQPGLLGRKLLIIRPRCWYCPPFEVAHIVAIDTLDAGVGDEVLVCFGEPARQALLSVSENRNQPVVQLPSATPGYSSAGWLPVDAAVMAIVDRTELVPGLRLPSASGSDVEAQR